MIVWNEKMCLGNAGASTLAFPPEAVFPCALHDLDSLHCRDVTMEELRKQILHFVHTYATYIVEE